MSDVCSRHGDRHISSCGQTRRNIAQLKVQGTIPVGWLQHCQSSLCQMLRTLCLENRSCEWYATYAIDWQDPSPSRSASICVQVLWRLSASSADVGRLTTSGNSQSLAVLHRKFVLSHGLWILEALAQLFHSSDKTSWIYRLDQPDSWAAEKNNSDLLRLPSPKIYFADASTQ